MNKQGKIMKRLEEFSDNKFRLTGEQRNIISKLLPTGYSLKLVVLPKKHNKTRERSHQKIREVRSTTMMEQEIVNTEQIKQSKLSRKISKKLYQKQRKKEFILNEPAFKDEQECFSILHQLKKQSAAKPFLKPVDAEAQGVPDYYDIITDPMDLKTIQKKLKNKQYGSKKHFHDDVKKIFTNSYYFNQRDSEIFKATFQLEKYYLNCIKDQVRDKRKQEIILLQKHIIEINKKNESNFQLKKNSKEIQFKEEDLTRIGEQLNQLQQHEMKIISEFLNQNNNFNMIEVDLNSLDKKKLLIIQRYLCLKERVLSNRKGIVTNWFQQ